MLTRTRALAAAGGLVAAAVTGAITAPAAHAATNLGSTLAAGKTITVGNYLSNGAYKMVMQADGNLVVYKSNTPVFASYTTGKNNRATMQADGNLVVRSSSGAALWNTLTAGRGADRAVLQADGNFVLRDGSTAEWATMTNGRSELHNSHVYSVALTMIGKYDYVYGGGHDVNPPGPSKGGLDCSGLVRFVYYLAAGRDVIGDTDSGAQQAESVHDSVGAPGELVFYRASDTGRIHHVGIYAGAGQLINEYSTGHKTLVNSVDAHSGTKESFYSKSW